jgi:multidrug transporter EmrE-like cation transporter
LSFASLALLLFAVGSAATGQLMLKYGMNRASQSTGASLLVRTVTSPWVLAGLAIFAVSAVAWLTTLSSVPLSIAYPFNALGYLAILTFSSVILDERTNLWTWVGTFCVIAGLVLVVATRPSP